MEKTSQSKPKLCNECGKKAGFPKVDPCLGELPGVKSACCGHGKRKAAYILFDNNIILRGFKVETLEKAFERSLGNGIKVTKVRATSMRKI